MGDTLIKPIEDTLNKLIEPISLISLDEKSLKQQRKLNKANKRDIQKRRQIIKDIVYGLLIFLSLLI